MATPTLQEVPQDQINNIKWDSSSSQMQEVPADQVQNIKWNGSDTTAQPKPFDESQGITGQDIVQHPLKSIGKTIMQPAMQSLTGKSMEQTNDEAVQNNKELGQSKVAPFDQNLGIVKPAALAANIGGQVVDQATTPANYIGGKLIKEAPAIGAMAGAFGNRLVKAASELPENINNLASPIRDYAGNKVNAIRSGAKLFWKNEMDAYGQGLDKLSNNPKQVPLNNIMQKATQTMVDRKLYDPVQGKWVPPLTPVDSQLVKSYKQLGRNFNDNGTASVGDIVKEYQKIRDSAPLGTSMGREARTVASEFLNGASKDIDLPEYKNLNARYADFKNKFDTIDSKVDVWGNPEKTARGENFLTRGLSKTMEARKATQNIQANTGQTLKGAKVLNAVNNLPLAKYIIPH